MKRVLKDALSGRYPRIFVGKHGGFDTGDGWYNLLDLLSARIQAHVDAGKCPQVEAEQVKEKYGGLRFYYTGGDATVHALVGFAEDLSERTCETCGAPGTPNDEYGWIRTRCDAHKSER